ncbi:hypothetical protein F2Q69_00025345 [Brassica cretica]|uniref:Uncharacterized protein n=1 Tax=Brassica cretica TaxID=69181 RepID=A0A8S9QA48_BRACR|nr:hypothetical protein F2Q69_00025345 [Brassica cretica]
MAEPISSSTIRSRRFSEVDYSFGENYRYRSEVPFASFDECLQRSRHLFSSAVLIIGDKTNRFPNNEAASGYRCLSLRGFVVQGSLDPKDRSLDEAFEVIDSVGWAYTVMHVHPFCRRVVREFISNQPFDDEGVLIRGHGFQFSPSVINRLMMTPSVTQSFGWREVVLKEAISHLTGGECSGWTGFNLNALINPFQTLYRVCELNWLREFISNQPFDDEGVLIRGHGFQFSPSVINRLMMTPSVTRSFGWREVVLKEAISHLTGGKCPEADLMIKNRLRLLYAVAKRNPINFGHLVYDQVIEMTRLTDSDTNLVFPNLIYQLLMLQHEVPLLTGDEKAIGRGFPIQGFAARHLVTPHVISVAAPRLPPSVAETKLPSRPNHSFQPETSGYSVHVAMFTRSCLAEDDTLITQLFVKREIEETIREMEATEMEAMMK